MEAIYDRNLIDIQNAKNLRDKIMQHGFDSLGGLEKTTWLNGMKAFLNNTDLNRIEKNCKTLADLMELDIKVKTDWKIGDFPTQKDFIRIRSNVALIRKQNYIHKDTPKVPMLPLNRYDKINDIEKILFDAYEQYNSNHAYVEYIGEVYDCADYIYWLNTSVFDYVNEIYADEEIGVI